MSLRIEPSFETLELNVGDLVDVIWEIPYDRAKSDVEFLFLPGPTTLSGDDLTKEKLEETDEYGRHFYEYRANRVELTSTKTDIEASTEKAVDIEYVSVAPSL